MPDICDLRDFQSSEIRELRDRKICGFRKDASMSDPHLEIRLWMQRELRKKGHGAKGALAQYLGVRQDAVTRMANTDPSKEKREIRAADLLRMIEFFGSEPPSTQTQQERLVPIVGLAGAGPDGSVLYAEGDGNFGEVIAPLDASPTTVALEVRGNSMHGLANDGWLIFYDEKEPPGPDHMGEPCVCWLEDGRVLIKVPYPGSQRGLFNLESVNAPTMRDVPVRFFALVTDIKPRRSAQKFIRRNPDHGVQDLKVRNGN